MEKQGKKMIVCGLHAAAAVVVIPSLWMRNFPRKTRSNIHGIKRKLLQHHACVPSSSSSYSNKRRRTLVLNDTDFSNVDFNFNVGHGRPHHEYGNGGSHTRRIHRKPTRSQILAMRTRIDLEYSRLFDERAQDEEQYEQPQEERVAKVEVMGPSTPALKKYKQARGSQVNRADKLSAVKEVENASYYTRSINKRVISELICGEESSMINQEKDTTVSIINGPTKTTQRNLKFDRQAEKQATKAWKSLLKEGSFDIIVGREVSFISKVGNILGSRVYKPWKGSVLNSIIGAFLSQRVGDNTSSSAIISLGKVFPVDPSCDKIDSVDWNKLMHAKTEDVAQAIAVRGMNKKLAIRIKSFLKKTQKKQGKLDLEGLRNAEFQVAKKFLLSIHGIGVKSAECVLLLTLRQPAFPVDINVARVTARLGWIPAPPASDDIKMHVLEERSSLQHAVHRYLWTGLYKLDKDTLYQLHCLMITFGKVFCTNQKPNCSSCPMRSECRYYISQQGDRSSPSFHGPDIEDLGSFLVGTSNAEAPLTPEKRTKAPKTPLKINTRTEHLTYELPDCHPILKNFDRRDPDDESPYLLVTGEIDLERNGGSSPNCLNEPEDVPGTIMIPYRTALRGTFPLNATHFQKNEVFADMETNKTPVNVPRNSLQGLCRKTLYCGRNLTGICKGRKTEDIRRLFHEGYICIRRFDRRTYKTSTLDERLHKSTSTRTRNVKRKKDVTKRPPKR